MFFLIPVGVEYAARRYPVVTFTLMGINTAIYLIGLVLGNSGDAGIDPLVEHFALVPSDKIWWTWLTSTFVHAGFFHLAGNMIYLFLFGSCVEDLLGRARFTGFYLGGGLVANLCQILLTSPADADIPIVGASGAISACIGGFLVVLPRVDINFRYFGWILFRPFSGEFSLKAWIVVMAWFLMDFASLLLSLHFANGGGGGVALGAHLGGTMAGAAILGLRSLAGNLDASDSDLAVAGGSAPAKRSADDTGEPATVLLWIDGQQAGPFAPTTVRQMLALGSISGETLFLMDGMSDWLPVSDL